MLTLTRKPGESVLIGEGVRVVAIKGNRVRLSLTAPPEVRILRAELAEDAPPPDAADRAAAGRAAPPPAG